MKKYQTNVTQCLFFRNQPGSHFQKKKKKISSGEKLPGDGCIFIAAVTRHHSHHSHPPAGFSLLEGHSAGWLSELLLPLLQIKKINKCMAMTEVPRWDAEMPRFRPAVETLTRPSPLSLHVGSIRWSCCLLYWIRNF